MMLMRRTFEADFRSLNDGFGDIRPRLALGVRVDEWEDDDACFNTFLFFFVFFFLFVVVVVDVEYRL